MNFKLYPALLVATLFLSACSKSESDKCNKAENVDSGCVNTVTDIDSRPISLSLTFLESYFYDSVTKSWLSFSVDNLNGGVTGTNVPVYSSFLNLSVDEAIEKIEDAKDQKQNPGNYLPRDFNIIPYIEVKYEKGSIMFIITKRKI